jgi:hypothetical protein
VNATLELLRRQASNNLRTYNERGSKLGGPVLTPTAPRQTPTTPRQLPALTGNDLRDFIAAVKLVPAGNYALQRPDGAIDFLEVVHEGNRDWVRTLVGAPGAWKRVRMTYRLMMFAARHIAADPLAASQRYGLRFQECGKCGSPLSNPESRAAGIGPKCRKMF